MNHRSSMDIRSMLNEDTEAPEKDRRSSQAPQILPSLSQLHTGRSSPMASGPFSQGPGYIASPHTYPQTPAYRPPFDRRSSSFQAPSPHGPLSTPTTPHDQHAMRYQEQSQATQPQFTPITFARRSSSRETWDDGLRGSRALLFPQNPPTQQLQSPPLTENQSPISQQHKLPPTMENDTPGVSQHLVTQHFQTSHIQKVQSPNPQQRKLSTIVGSDNPDGQQKPPTQELQTSHLQEIQPSISPQQHLPTSSHIDNLQANVNLSNMANQGNKRKLEAPVSIPSKRLRLGEIPIWAQQADPAKVRPLAKYLRGGQSSNIKKSHNKVAAPATKDDEIMKDICSFIYRYVVQNPYELQPKDGQFEIEAKIGKIEGAYDFDSKDLREIALSQDYAVKFESDTTQPVHKKINVDLNSAVEISRRSSLKPHDPSKLKPHRWACKHKREVDSQYTLTQTDISSLSPLVRNLLHIRPGRDPTCRLRVTRDKDEKEILAKIIKHRIADLHVRSPRSKFDYRISINFEALWNGDVETVILANGGTTRDDSKDRRKDRISYGHGPYQVDLTQVKLKGDDDKDEKEQGERASHELEVELNACTVTAEAQKGDGPYEELVRGFLADIRTLLQGSGRIGDGVLL